MRAAEERSLFRLRQRVNASTATDLRHEVLVAMQALSGGFYAPEMVILLDGYEAKLKAAWNYAERLDVESRFPRRRARQAGAATMTPAARDRAAGERLLGGLHEMVQAGRLTAAEIPDDFDWLCAQLAACAPPTSASGIPITRRKA